MIFFYLLVSGMPLVNQSLFAHFVNDLTFAKYLGVASLLFACFEFLRKGDTRAFANRLMPAMVVLYLLITVSYLTQSLPYAWQLSPFLSFTSFAALFFVVAVLVDSPLRLRRTLYAAIAAVALGSVYMVREWVQYHNVYKDFRPGYVVGDSNYFSVSALLCLPFLYYMLQERSRPWVVRLFMLGILLLTLLGVALGASRGGFLGLVAEFLMIMLYSKRRRRILFLAPLILLPLFALTPISSIHRLLHPDYSDVTAENNRLVVWRAGLSMVRQHPLRGIGLGNYKPLVVNYETAGPKVQTLAHNTYLEFAAELGLPGLALFGFMFVGAFRLAGRSRRRAAALSPELAHAAAALQAALVGAAVAICFLSAADQKLLWLMLALAPCIDRLTTLAVGAESAPAAPPVVEPVPALATPLPRRRPELVEMWR